MSRTPPTSLRRKVEDLCPDIETLKDWQWNTAVKLIWETTSVFLMMPCGSGKTYVWIAMSILLALFSGTQQLSHDVIIVYAPLNEIIQEQIQKVRSMKGWRAWNFGDDPKECEKAMSVDKLLNPTIVFWNPHEKTWDRFLAAIQNSVAFRIKAQVADEAGTMVDWGSGDDFRWVLRKLKQPMDVWRNVCRKKELPMLVMTGAASPSTRHEIDTYFLNHDGSWGQKVLTSPLGTCHVVLKVITVQTRAQETNVVVKGVAKAAADNPPPAKLLVLVPFVKQLKDQRNQLLAALNPHPNKAITESVQCVFAGDECIGRETDLKNYTSGTDGRDRTLCATTSMVATGWNCHGITNGWLKGQTNNVELLIQAWFRVARGGFTSFGVFVVVVSWFRRLELQFHAFVALTAQKSSQATRRTAEQQRLAIDELSFVLLFPDAACLLVLVDTLIMGELSTHKSCSTRHRTNQTLWCSSCIANATAGDPMIYELQAFYKKWCNENNKAEKVIEDWSKLIDTSVSGDCVVGVPAACLKQFVDSLGEKTTNRVGNINTIRHMMDPLRLTQHMVEKGLKAALPSPGSMVTMATLKASLFQTIPAGATEQLVVQCIQRLVLKAVLKDQPPMGISSKEQAAAHPGNWLVSRGVQFANFRKWPLLQPPARTQSRISSRSKKKQKRK